MLSLLFDVSAIYDVLIAVIAIIALIIFLKFKSVRVFILSLAYVLFLIITFVCGVHVNNYYSASGGIWGEITSVSSKVEVENMNFDLKNLSLVSTGLENEYSLEVKTEEVLKLSDGVHAVYVNDIPCNTVSYSSDYLVCNYDYVFYNKDLKEILNDQLTIKFSFYNNGTSIVLTTSGGVDAVGLWNNYFNLNNFIITIK